MDEEIPIRIVVVIVLEVNNSLKTITTATSSRLYITRENSEHEKFGTAYAQNNSQQLTHTTDYLTRETFHPTMEKSH